MGFMICSQSQVKAFRKILKYFCIILVPIEGIIILCRVSIFILTNRERLFNIEETTRDKHHISHARITSPLEAHNIKGGREKPEL